MAPTTSGWTEDVLSGGTVFPGIELGCLTTSSLTDRLWDDTENHADEH